MAKIVQISDFKGDYSITMNSFSGAHLQNFINTYEVKYLRDLLGITLSTDLLTDITTPFTAPTNTDYLAIFNPLAYDYESTQIISDGIKEMLVGFIYFEYTRFQKIQNTITGNVNAQNEVSTMASWGETNIYINYNKAIDSYKSIQYHISLNEANYSTFNGVCKGYTSEFI
jgi:hypothetical protein